jgi:hypothetical protein
VRLLRGEALARGRYAHQLALVRAAARASYRHRLPAGGRVLDVEAVIGKDGEEPLPDAPGPAVTVLVGGGGAVDVPGRDELAYGVEVVSIRDLLDVAYSTMASFPSAVVPTVATSSYLPFLRSSNDEGSLRLRRCRGHP